MPTRRRVKITNTPTIEEIDEALARLSVGRDDPRCEQWINDLLDKRNELASD